MNWETIQKIEFLKLSSKSSKTYLFTHLILLAVSLFLAFTIRFAITSGSESPKIPSFSIDPTTNYYLFLEAFSLIPIFTLSVFLIHIVSQEFSLGINKKHFIDGMSKGDMVFSKIILIFYLSIFSCIASFILSILIGIFFKNMGLTKFFSHEFLWSNIVFFIKSFFILTFSYFIIVLVRTSSFTIFILITYWIFEKTIAMILNSYQLNIIVRLLPFQNLNTFTEAGSINTLIISILTINLIVLLAYYTFTKRNL
jgi:hypothetical protein